MSEYQPMGFESDVGNRQFQGAQNPDSLLHVDIYWEEPVDKNKTEDKMRETGIYRPIREPRQIFIRIMKPGDKNSIIETPLREDHKRRFPDKWQYFQIQEGMVDGGANQPGWKIEDWDEENGKALTEEEVHRLKFLRFYTVEQIAGASDAQVSGIGMGGLGLRKRAQDACKQRYTAEVRKEINAKDKELAEMKARMEKLESLIFAKHDSPKVEEVPVQPQPNSRVKRKYTRKVKPEVKEVTA